MQSGGFSGGLGYSGISTFYGFVRELWDILPSEITALIWFSLLILVLYTVLRSLVH